MGSFSDSLKANCDKVLKEIDAKCYSLYWQLSTNIVMITPSPSFPGRYAKGHLANQWYSAVGIGNFSSELDDSTSPTGSDSIARITALAGVKEFYGKDGAMSLSNNCDYAQQAESQGWNRTGPYRMVMLSMQKVLNENA